MPIKLHTFGITVYELSLLLHLDELLGFYWDIRRNFFNAEDQSKDLKDAKNTLSLIVKNSIVTSAEC